MTRRRPRALWSRARTRISSRGECLKLSRAIIGAFRPAHREKIVIFHDHACDRAEPVRQVQQLIVHACLPWTSTQVEVGREVQTQLFYGFVLPTGLSPQPEHCCLCESQPVLTGC